MFYIVIVQWFFKNYLLYGNLIDDLIYFFGFGGQLLLYKKISEF